MAMKIYGRTPTKAKIYWDSQDCDNEGWAYQLADDDGAIESGPWEEYSGQREMWEHVDDFAHEYDLPDHHAWMVEPDAEGGFAIWEATTDTRSVDVFGDNFQVAWDGNVWVSPVNGKQHAHAADAMRSELTEYFRSCGDDTDDAEIGEQIDSLIAAMP